MGREVKTIGTAPVWYVPDVEGNREDPKPFRVKISPLTAGEKAQIEHARTVAAIRDTREGIEEITDYVREDVYRILGERIVEVENYAARDVRTGEVTTPTDGASLVEVIKTQPGSELAVLDDIYAAMESISKLEGGMRGNSERPSVSSGRPMSGAKTPASEDASTMTRGSGGALTSTMPGIQLSHVSSETPGGVPEN
jgi:hypothetical protein